jgi:hypothetical protein
MKLIVMGAINKKGAPVFCTNPFAQVGTIKEVKAEGMEMVAIELDDAIFKMKKVKAPKVAKAPKATTGKKRGPKPKAEPAKE